MGTIWNGITSYSLIHSSRGRRMRLVAFILSLSLCVLSALPLNTEEEQPHYLNQFLIKVDKRDTAYEIANHHGFVVRDELEDLGYHLLEHPSVSRRTKRHASDHVQKLLSDPRVQYVEQQKVLIRDKREIIYDKQVELESRDYDPEEYYRVRTPHMYRRGKGEDGPVFNDKYFEDEWYCQNVGQSGGKRDVDLNVMAAWKNGFIGTGVTVVVLDDGIDHTHKDLAANYAHNVSADFNDPDDVENDPTPRKDDSSNSHGTKCAGEIAAVANNGICGVGIAYGSKVGGIRLLDGDVTDHLEAKALNYKKDLVDIMSASWGPRDNGATMEMPGRATKEALERGVREGRNGKGTIFVWATGNGGVHDDDCGADGYVSAIETLSIGSATDRGQAPYFMEMCSSTFAVVPSGGEVYAGEFGSKPKIKVVTTDINNGCTLGFEGTSAAAPLAAGCVALMLQANPALKWRDVQHIVAETARIPSTDKSWIINGGGYHVSHTFGFGVMDCGAMVELAQDWKEVGDQHTCRSQMLEVNKRIPPRQCVTQNLPYPRACQQNDITTIHKLEHVQLDLKVEHSNRGDVEVFVESPSGTVSQLLSTRSNDHSTQGIDFQCMTVHTWGEDPEGQWSVSVCDNSKAKQTNTGKFIKFQLIWHGTKDDKHDIFDKKQKAYKPSLDDVEKIEKEELQRSKRLKIKRQKGEKRENGELGAEGVTENREEHKERLMKEIAQILSKRGYQEDTVEEALQDLGKTNVEKKRFHPEPKAIGEVKKNLQHLQERTFANKQEESDSALSSQKSERVDQLYDRVLDGLQNYLEKREENERKMEEERRLSLAERYINSVGRGTKRNYKWAEDVDPYEVWK